MSVTTEYRSSRDVTVARKSKNIHFIHGLCGYPGQWNEWLEAFSPYYVSKPTSLFPVNVTDPGKDGIADYISMAERQLEARGNVLIGHSLGALIAQCLANKHQDSIDALVLLQPSPDGNIPFLQRFTWQAQKQLCRMRYQLAMLRNRSFHLSEKSEQFLRGDSQAVFLPESGRILRELTFGAFRVKPVDCPVLLVVARNDQAIPRGVSEVLKELHPRAELEIVDGDHMAPFSRKHAPRIQQIVFEWIESLDS